MASESQQSIMKETLPRHVSPPLLAPDDPEVIQEVRRHEDEARRLLLADNCWPVCPEEVQYPYSRGDRRVPEEDREGFDYFLQPTYPVGVLEGQLESWKDFRLRDTLVHLGKNPDDFADDDNAASVWFAWRIRHADRFPRRTPPEDWKRYHVFYEDRRALQMRVLDLTKQLVRECKMSDEEPEHLLSQFYKQEHEVESEKPFLRWMETRRAAMAALEPCQNAQPGSQAVRQRCSPKRGCHRIGERERRLVASVASSGLVTRSRREKRDGVEDTLYELDDADKPQAQVQRWRTDANRRYGPE